ncbi:Hsp20/alpha crystallin family protein [Ancylostoma duodenale]|uniref:Hsp20/alpha crystallin family protein n=1 Tax=Ancylostoma duodenale TaxID=51022 RepID=A0A0C2FW35_9BILA|nr:Hsp20/alpha crystallin family protein [Ancylostoma duodenale]KIH49166.1 Hsp20/alpha crystallin family protein [Ancylostoma duodenale]
MDRRFRLPTFSPLNFHSRFFDDFDFDRSFGRPYWHDQSMLTGHKIGEGVDVVDNDKEYSVSVDVSQFEPEELTVNIVDNTLIIEGKHAEKSDKFGRVERHFVRKYDLPTSVKGDEVKSELSKEGILTVKYDRHPEMQPKVIPISIKPK